MNGLKLFKNTVSNEYYIAIESDYLEEVKPQDCNSRTILGLLEDLNQVNFSKFEICQVNKILNLYGQEFSNTLKRLKNFRPICDFNENIIIVENMTFKIHDWGLILTKIEDKFYKTDNGDKIINSLDEKDVDLIKKLCDHPFFEYRNKSFGLITIGSSFYGSLDIKYLTNPIFKNIFKFEDHVYESCKILNKEESYWRVEFENKKYIVYNGDDEMLTEYAVSQIINDYLENKGRPLFDESILINIYNKMNIPDDQRKFFKKNNLEEAFFDGEYDKCFREYYINKYDLKYPAELMRSSDSNVNPFKNPNSPEYIDFNREINNLKGEWGDLIVGEPFDLDIDEENYRDLYFGTNTSDEDVRFLVGKDKNTGITFLLRIVGWGWGPGMYC